MKWAEISASWPNKTVAIYCDGVPGVTNGINERRMVKLAPWADMKVGERRGYTRRSCLYRFE